MQKKNRPEEVRLHPRNKNRERYNLKALKASNPELKKYITINKFGVESIDFSNPLAVRLLNKALLNHYYGIKYWEFPDKNLCPPIPGRADYIHHMADLLAENNSGTIPIGDKITCLDVGVGASCIYPVIGVTEYGWRFIGSDIDPKSIAAAKDIVRKNPLIKGNIECRLQKDTRAVFQGILDKKDNIDLVICNPPFHSSVEDAQKGTRRKIENLSGKKVKTPELNFAGISSELIYDGGEHKFIQNMIRESEKFSKNCYWFSSIVSKQANLQGMHKLLEIIKVNEVKTIPLKTGNKSSRVIAWTFLTKEEQKEWRDKRWKTTLKN